MEANQVMTTKEFYHRGHKHQEEAYWVVLSRVDITLLGVTASKLLWGVAIYVTQWVWRT